MHPTLHHSISNQCCEDRIIEQMTRITPGPYGPTAPRYYLPDGLVVCVPGERGASHPQRRCGIDCHGWLHINKVEILACSKHPIGTDHEG